MSLDFSAFANAISQLEKSLDYATSPLAKNDPGLFEQLRNSVIQCFEFTYELSHKMLKRFLKETAASAEDINTHSFQDLIRTGNEKGLLRSDWLVWRTYRQARNNSSHTYDADKAEQVYQIAADFLLEVKYLHQQLIARSNKE
ncbi:MAG: HI0074 family nucleotidyltransferase substrate-binding subunit [Methyloprofundus sp.]|nr:HI0074 family nucleotidyltransferase substrate-binding subunit [Methyloprofundus sp.]MDT8426804.1 HI0074 family nucleotidyltransferase substrate-binding subunit [Methyloprofundus sp.]